MTLFSKLLKIYDEPGNSTSKHADYMKQITLGIVNLEVTDLRLVRLAGNIRVFCRVRPMLSTEKHAREGPLTTPGVDIVRIPTARKYFKFDRVFHPSSVQGGQA